MGPITRKPNTGHRSRLLKQQTMSNFAEAYTALPHPIQHVLKNDDIEALRTDAQLYVEK